jgi:uncharacterized membrane protein
VITLIVGMGVALSAPVAKPGDLPWWIETTQAMQSYEQCIRSRSISLGVKNNEPATSVIQGAKALCVAESDHMRITWEAMPFDRARGSQRYQHFMSQFDNEAVAVLIESRAH